MKAIHGGKAKNDDIDAEKIARLLKGGNIPVAYVYPKGLRETRDLLRRRMYFVQQRAALITHVQIVNAQYNLPEFSKKLIYAKNRAELKIAERFDNPQLRKSVEVDLALIDVLDERIAEVELHLERTAKIEDPQTFHLLKTIGGVGKILGLTLLVRDSRHRSFSRCRRIPVVRAAGALPARVGGQEARLGRSQDRQCPSEVGVFRSGVLAGASPSDGEGLAGPAREEARQEEDARHLGGASGPYRLSHAAQA